MLRDHSAEDKKKNLSDQAWFRSNHKQIFVVTV